MNGSLLNAAGLGAISGLRSMQGLAWVSHELSGRRRRFRATRLEQWLAEDTVSVVLSGLALGELVADKLPGVPPRIAPGPLVGRAAMGAVVGAIATRGDGMAVGAVVGAAAAVVGSYLGWFLRSEAVRATHLPDAAIAVAEDAVAVFGARSLAENL